MLPALVALELDFLKTPPFATYSILVIAVGLGLITSFVNARMTDLKAYRKMMLDSAKAQHQMMEAAKSGNQRAIDKAQKKQQEVMGTSWHGCGLNGTMKRVPVSGSLMVLAPS